MANPYFEFKQFKVYHDRCGMKVSTDACILGAYTRKVGARSILDIGAGSGLLSLMMAQTHPEAAVASVELDESAFSQLEENVSRSPWKDRVSAHCAPIQDFACSSEEKFELIISNPPFYPDHNKAQDKKRSQAFHTDALSFQDLARSASLLLSDDGLFFVLLPQRQSAEFRFAAHSFDLFVQKKLSVRSKDGGKVIREIVAYGKQRSEKREEEELAVYQETGVYTQQFESLLRPFYLYL